MVSSTFKFILLSALTPSAVANPVPAPISPCAAVHIIVARASGEDQGPGIIGALAEQVQRQSRQTVSSSNVVYPATLTDYADSSSAGTAAAKIMLTEQVNRCPNQKIVMMGYSQGAHVIGDALAGGGGLLIGPRTDPVPASIANKVVAIIQMGDPRHVGRKPYNRGTSLRDGLFPRLSSQEFSSTLQPRVQSFCDFGDNFCDGGVLPTVHFTYLIKYQDTAADFVLAQIGG